jgi:hypothetical protein
MKIAELAPRGHYVACVVVLLDTGARDVHAQPITMLYEAHVPTDEVERDVLDYLRATPDAIPEGNRVVGVYVTHTWEVRA